MLSLPVHAFGACDMWGGIYKAVFCIWNSWLSEICKLLPLYCFRTASVVLSLACFCALSWFLSCDLLPLVPLVMSSIALQCFGCFSLRFIRFSCSFVYICGWLCVVVSFCVVYFVVFLWFIGRLYILFWLAYIFDLSFPAGIVPLANFYCYHGFYLFS